MSPRVRTGGEGGRFSAVGLSVTDSSSPSGADPTREIDARLIYRAPNPALLARATAAGAPAGGVDRGAAVLVRRSRLSGLSRLPDQLPRARAPGSGDRRDGVHAGRRSVDAGPAPAVGRARRGDGAGLARGERDRRQRAHQRRGDARSLRVPLDRGVHRALLLAARRDRAGAADLRRLRCRSDRRRAAEHGDRLGDRHRHRVVHRPRAGSSQRSAPTPTRSPACSTATAF